MSREERGRRKGGRESEREEEAGVAREEWQGQGEDVSTSEIG